MPDEDLTPEEAQVRRLLADARHAEPMPADVADRLDRVLADLHADRRADRRADSPAAPEPVTDLAAARRRRRTVGGLLVAAAAVVALGLGLPRLDDLATPGADDSGAGAGAAESQPLTADDGSAGDLAFAELDPDRFDSQVRRLVARSAFADVPSDGDPGQRELESRPGCPEAGWGTGVRVPVLYGGQAGVLVVRPASGGTRTVDLYLCGNPSPTRSVEVPAG